jgi:outer membrane protein assembly factor BamB
MEPQINYGSSYQGSSPMGQQKVYGRSGSGCARKGCFSVVGTGVLLIIIILAGIFFVYPALTSNSIHGDFLDMAIVPQKDGSTNLWILTDGSFNFIQTTKSPGSYSTGRKCYFCKTWTYIYDPAGEKILKKTKTEQEDIITKIDMVYYKGKVWVLTHEYGKNEPKIEVYDGETSNLIMDTKAFMAKYPELSGGLAGINYTEKENTMTLNTKDGREQLTYSFDNDMLYNDFSAFRDAMVKSEEPSSVVVLNAESSSGPRKKLYKVSGPKGTLFANMTSVESNANNEKTLEFFVKGATSQPLGDKVYLEGIIYYQDQDCTLIVYLDQLGKKSNRILTCIDNKTGKEKWTVQQDDMFKHMKIDENSDSFSSLFFTKDKIKLKREGNLVVLELKGDGIMGFDYNTGKKLWTLDI